VGKISKENIDIIREYLLSFDEGVRNNIRGTISATLLKHITIIESGFIKDESIDKISTETGYTESIEDLLKIRNEYFVSLAQISLDHSTNQTLEQIKSNNNQSFQKLLNEMADNDSFEKDMGISLKSLKRDEMKKLFQEIDKEDEFEISDNEIKAAITSLERESMKKRFSEIDKEEHRSKVFKLITRYAVAAVLLGAIIGGAYLRFFNHNISNDNSLAHNDLANINKTLTASTEIPNLIESKENKASIVIDKTSSGLATINQSITIKTNGLSRQIDTLRSILEKEMPQNAVGHSAISNRITKQIDSLLNILNTYTYDYKNKMVVLNIPKVSVVGNVISINPNNLSQLYLKIEGQYYFIKSTEKPMKLYPVSDKSLIQQLDFLND
jgi:hypothetical protein